MNELWLRIGCLAAGCLLLAGCDGREALVRGFRDAPLSKRQQIEEAVRLDRADNYMRAAEDYDAVLREGVTAAQEQAVQTAIDKLYSRMCKAAARGDPQAKQTLEAIEANQKAGR